MALVRPNKKAQGLLMILPSHTGTWLEGCIVSPKAVHIGIKQEPRKPDPLPFQRGTRGLLVLLLAEHTQNQGILVLLRVLEPEI